MATKEISASERRIEVNPRESLGEASLGLLLYKQTTPVKGWIRGTFLYPTKRVQSFQTDVLSLV
jgi:hypothetical protein